MTSRAVRAFALVVASAAAPFTATGCTMFDSHQAESTPQPSATVTQIGTLPTLEETKTELLAAMDTITQAATQRIAGTEWRTQSNADSGSCPAPYDSTDGISEYLPNRYASNVMVSERDWAALLQIAKDAAAGLGATDVQTTQDSPANHNVRFSGPAGIYINIGYQGNLGVSGYTGCRLPQGKRAPTQ